MFKNRVVRYLLISLVGLLLVGGVGFFVVNNSVEIQLTLGERYLTRLDYEKAISAYKKVISKDSKNVEAYLGLSSVYIGLESLDKAEEVLQRGISEIESNPELTKNLEFVRRLRTVFNLVSDESTSGIVEKVETEDSISAEDNPAAKPQFVNNLDINIDDYEEFNRQNFDLNQDGVEETILLIGSGSLTYLDESYIVVLDSEDNVLTIAYGSESDITIENFEDLTGDGIAEIIMYCSLGGTAGGWNRILEFVDGTYQDMELPDTRQSLELESSFVDDFKYVRTYTINGEKKVAETFLLYDQLSGLKDYGIYDSQGNLKSDVSELYHSMGYFFEDINGDGVKEYITLGDISVTCNACSEVSINTVHEYIDGQLKVKEFYLHSALENYGSSYNTYQQVQEAKQLIYNKYQADEKTLEVRFVNDDAKLSESYYVFYLISEPYSSTPKVHMEQLLVEKQTNKLFYMSTDGKITELN